MIVVTLMNDGRSVTVLAASVSYTHLDVYKRQVLANALSGAAPATFSCSSRATATADPAGLKQVLVATLSKKAVVDSAGTAVTVTMPDATAAWSAAHIAIAYADTYGVKSVAVADKTWSTALMLSLTHI